MKSTLFLIFGAIAALQVDFAIGSVDSRIEELNELWYRAHTVYKRVKVFKETEVDSRRDKINNSTVSLLEEITRLTLTTQKEIEDEADKYAAEDDNINVDVCVDAAINQLKYVILYDCGAFGTCRNRSEEEIKKITIELIEYIKVLEETKMTIVYVRDVACRNLTDYAQEFCLYCRIPQIEVQVVTYEKKVERFTKRALILIAEIVQQVYKCLDGAKDSAKQKIESIASEAKTCFEQLCNSTTTTLPPTTTDLPPSGEPTTMAPTTVAPTTPAPTTPAPTTPAPTTVKKP